MNNISEPIYLWNPSKKSYNLLKNEDYTGILDGKLKI